MNIELLNKKQKQKTKMKTYKKSLLLFSLATLFIIGCKDDDETTNPAPIQQGEVITMIQLLMRDTITNVTDTITYSDSDGPGGNAPVIDSILLSSGRVYEMSLLLLDESKSPVDTVSNEIEEEADRHLFVFTASPASNFINVNISDTDVNGNPLGLHSYFGCQSAGTGSFRLVLRHYNTAADKTNATSGYDSDIDVTFGVRLQ
jgi:hypothetical protein